jgi:hypothetical protein
MRSVPTFSVAFPFVAPILLVTPGAPAAPTPSTPLTAEPPAVIATSAPHVDLAGVRSDVSPLPGFSTLVLLRPRFVQRAAGERGEPLPIGFGTTASADFRTPEVPPAKRTTPSLRKP